MGFFESFAESAVHSLIQWLPKKHQETVFLRTFGLLKVPVLFFISPKVLEVTAQRCVVEIPLNRRTKNHLNCMYFGALAAGADCAGGLIAMRMIQEEGNQVALIFKDFHADFLKRAEGNVHIVCEQGVQVRELVKKAMESGERESMLVHLTAFVPSKLGQEPVAHFDLTLSLKRKKKRS